MRIREITHERVKNIGNYESVRVSITAILDADDDPREVMQELKREAMEFLKVKPKTKEKP